MRRPCSAGRAKRRSVYAGWVLAVALGCGPSFVPCAASAAGAAGEGGVMLAAAAPAPRAGPAPKAADRREVRVAALAPPDVRAERVARHQAAASERGRAIDRGLIALRLVLVVLAIGLGYWRLWRPDRRRRLRSAILLVLALLAFGANYNFFVWTHKDGIHAHEMFHYYVGSKYFPELGYFRIYECAVQAVDELRPARAPAGTEVRDLRNILERKTLHRGAAGPRCDGAFDPERWSTFKHDVGFVRNRMSASEWNRVITDQGFNASPVWILFGRPIASAFPAEPGPMRVLARIDLLLLAVAFGAVGWAFGFEALCLAVLVWGANPLSRYQWLGDTHLRQLWLSTCVVGVCLLAKRRDFAAGGFLAAASLMRIFPAVFVVGWGLRALRHGLAERRIDRRVLRLVAGGVLTSLVLVVASVPVSGRGSAVYAEFGENMATFGGLTARNSLGLRALLSHTDRQPVPYLASDGLRVTERASQDLKQQTFAARRPVYLGLLAVFLVLFWRALPHLEDWEAACLGFVLMWVLAQPASYYLASLVPAALLGVRRPRLALATLVLLATLCAVCLVLYGEATRYLWSSAAVLTYCLHLLIEIPRVPPDASIEASPGGARAPVRVA